MTKLSLVRFSDHKKLSIWISLAQSVLAFAWEQKNKTAKKQILIRTQLSLYII